MRNWFKIISGDKATAEEIGKEIDGLLGEIKALKDQIDEAAVTLDETRLKQAGGVAGTDDAVIEAERIYENLKNQAKTLEKAVVELELKRGQAIQADKEGDIKRIDKDLAKIEASRPKLLERYFKLAGELVAVHELLTGSSKVAIDRNTTGIEGTGDERQPFYDAYSKNFEGQTPLHIQRAHSHFPGHSTGTGLCVFAICFRQSQRPAL